MLRTSMILLVLGVLDGLSQSGGQSLRVRAIDPNHFVVSLEAFNALDLLECLLEVIL